jgi:hypothetical protein
MVFIAPANNVASGSLIQLKQLNTGKKARLNSVTGLIRILTQCLITGFPIPAMRGFIKA